MNNKFIFNKLAQSTMEYAVVISSIVVAFVLLQNYVSRGLQGNLRGAADSIGPQFDPLKYSAYVYVYKDTGTSMSSLTDISSRITSVEHDVSFGPLHFYHNEDKVGYDTGIVNTQNIDEETTRAKQTEEVLPW